MIRIYFDGAIAPINPGGHAGAGFVVIFDGGDTFCRFVYIGHGPQYSSNYAEYAALVFALEYLLGKKMENGRIEVYGDSLLVIKQMKRRIPTKAKGLYAPMYERAFLLKQNFPKIAFIWIPREMNDRADVLSKAAVSGKCSNQISFPFTEKNGIVGAKSQEATIPHASEAKCR